MDFLQQMAEHSRERVVAAKRNCSEAEMLRRAADAPRAPALKLGARGFDVIAEIKRRSPAVGALTCGESIEARAAAYALAGAAAVSVLTEPSRFDGSMSQLDSVARSLGPLGVPTMRKDFLVDPYQVAEARAAGAGGVLLIVRMLPRTDLDALLRAARQLSLFVLLEAFDERDIELAHELVAASGPEGLLVGVNCRDLTTLQVVAGRLEKLAPLLPTTALRVAESGVSTPQDAHEAAAAGYDLALIGSALMRAREPAALLRAMLVAGSKR